MNKKKYKQKIKLHKEMNSIVIILKNQIFNLSVENKQKTNV